MPEATYSVPSIVPRQALLVKRHSPCNPCHPLASAVHGQAIRNRPNVIACVVKTSAFGPPLLTQLLHPSLVSRRFEMTLAVTLPSDEAATARAALVPPSLQLQWETQGVSGRAYQKDGNLALYRKKVRDEKLPQMGVGRQVTADRQ